MVCGIHTKVLLASHLCPTFLPLVTFLLLLASLCSGSPCYYWFPSDEGVPVYACVPAVVCVSPAPVADFAAVTNVHAVASVPTFNGIHIVAGFTA